MRVETLDRVTRDGTKTKRAFLNCVGRSPSCVAASFFERASGKQNKRVSKDDDYERAERAVLSAIATVENKVQKLVATEVETLFRNQEHHPKKSEVTVKARRAVEHGVNKVKQAAVDRSKLYSYPFDKLLPSAQMNKPHKHKDHRILHAVESAEKAVLHAIQTEVETLFHELDHHEDHKDMLARAKTTVKKGVQKAMTKVDEAQDHRREWFSTQSNALIEAYSNDFFLE